MTPAHSAEPDLGTCNCKGWRERGRERGREREGEGGRREEGEREEGKGER